MEPNQRKHKASNFAPQDFLSTMPDFVVTNIMDRLPLQEAVRTSLLARSWRLKWTLLSQLVFDENFFEYLLKRKAEEKYGRIVSRLLLHFKGAITKFVLYIEEGSKLDDEDISHWILFLSEKGIKDLENMNRTPLKLPTHLLSCLDLKHLKLEGCSFKPPSSFHGFPNLLTLDFGLMRVKSSIFGELIVRCPLLEILNMRFQSLFRFIRGDNVKLVEIAKLANLKILSLSLRNLDTIKSKSGIFELVGSLPKLEELHLDFLNCKSIQGAAKKRSPTSFPCLKALELTSIDLGNPIMLLCALELIGCSPRLQTLTFESDDADPRPATPEIKYNTMEPLQIRSVVFKDLKGLENEVCLIKYLLACSPFLKKIVIHPHSSLVSVEKLFVRKLLKLHRASPVAEIIIH